MDTAKIVKSAALLSVQSYTKHGWRQNMVGGKTWLAAIEKYNAATKTFNETYAEMERLRGIIHVHT
jgi:hypothetical protein